MTRQPEIDGFEILGLLGKGGMGFVYLARDLELGRKVAIKVISENLIERSVTRTRFSREAKLMASVEHPNIVRLYSFSNRDDSMYLVMEYIDGESLDQLLAREGRLSISRAIEITSSVAGALAVAWEQGIIHRDIKPSNILIDRDGGVHVADFGLAKPLVAEGGDLTGTGDLVGTPYYVSPEQVQGRRIDLRSDIYSLGLVFYEMLTGERPFPGASPLVVLSKNMTDDVPPPGLKRSEIPADVDRLAQSMTRRLMSQRPQSASLLIRELERVSNAEFVRDSASVAKTELSSQWRLATGQLVRRLLIAKRRVAVTTTAILAAVFVTVGIFMIGAELGSRGSDSSRPIAAQRLVVALTPQPVEGVDALQADVSGDQFDRLFESVLRRSERLQVVRSIEGSDQGLNDVGERIGPVDVAVSLRLERSALEIRGIGRLEFRGAGRGLEEIKMAGHEVADLAVDLGRKVSLVLEAVVDDFEDPRGLVPLVNTGSVDALRQYSVALDAAEAQNDEEAIAHLKKALTLDSSFAHAHESLAYSYMVLGESELAREAIDEAVANLRGVDELEALKIQRRRAQIYGDFVAELRHLRNLVLRDPERAEWHYLLGWFSFTHLRYCEKGLFEFRRALELSESDDPEHLYHLGFCELACEGPRAAVTRFLQYREALPSSADPLVSLAAAWRAAGEWQKAEQRLVEAEQLDPGFHALHLGWGNLRLAQGKIAAAKQHFESHLARSFGSNREEEGHTHLARAALEVGDWVGARQHAIEALGVDPDELEALWLLGRAQLASGDTASARRTLDRLHAPFVDDGSSFELHLVHHLRGRILLEEGDLRKAVSELRSAVDLHPYEQPFFLSELAESERLAGHLDAALDSLARAFEINPQSPRAHLAKARLLEQQARHPEAQQQYRLVLDLLGQADPDHLLRRGAELGLAR